jgi:gliding motility-associated-like protein
MTGPCNAPVTETVDITVGELDLTATAPGCNGAGGTATADVNGAAGPFTYSWSPGGATTQTITGLDPGLYTVVVNAPSMCPLEGTVEVEAGADEVTATVDHTNVTCAGLADGSATVTATGGAGGYTYAWVPSGGASASATGLAAGTYTCTITDAAACIAIVDVTISEPDPIDVIVPADIAICSGESITLSVGTEGGTPDFTFAWSPEGPDVAPSSTTTYTVIATDANGCSSAPEPLTVLVTDVAEPSFSWDVDSGCAPLCVVFTADPGVVGMRNWSFGDGSQAGDQSDPEHCYLSAGSFDVTLSIIDGNGCIGTSTEFAAITVSAGPIAAFEPSPEVAQVDAPTFRFIDRSVGATTWSWSFGDPSGSISEEPSPSFTYPGIGCYSVLLEVSDDEGCSSSASDEVCVEDAFALYAPNAFSPNSDGINELFGVVSTVADPSFFELTIFDRWGVQQYASTSPYKPWDGMDVPQGVYIWKVRMRDREGKMQERVGHVTLIR